MVPANEKETIQCLASYAIYARDVERFCSTRGLQRKVSCDDSKEQLESQTGKNRELVDDSKEQLESQTEKNRERIVRIDS